jgi:Domain of unknown function (DUF4145)
MCFNWICPHCNTKTTINEDRYQRDNVLFEKENSEGNRGLLIEWIVCPNIKCKKISLDLTLFDCLRDQASNWSFGEEIKHWKLLPGSYAKVYPDYIPNSLIEDYQEASSIVDLSPKASATLSRRCIQGIIRDFWCIKKNRLIDEIKALEEKVDPLVWQSIDAIRKIGNIGAHMEKDINLIIDVSPDEAQLLINLIELLFEEWYIQKHEREIKLSSIVKIAQEKEGIRKG